MWKNYIRVNKTGRNVRYEAQNMLPVIAGWSAQADLMKNTEVSHYFPPYISDGPYWALAGTPKKYANMPQNTILQGRQIFSPFHQEIRPLNDSACKFRTTEIRV